MPLRFKNHGFTLIEVLISLTLLVIILGAVYGSFFTVNRAFDRFDNASLKYHETRMVLDTIRREVESSIFKDMEKTPFVIKDRDRFGKTVSELLFTTLSLKNNLPIKVTYFIDDKDGVFRLLKKETLAIQTSDGFTTELIDNIKGFTVETLFNDKWVKTWDTGITNKPPEIIRVTIEFDDEGRDVKLTEYARLMIGKRL